MTPELPLLAVLWDVDGTLINTEELHYIVIRDFCAAHGYVLTEEGNEELLGLTMPEKWSILQPRLPQHVTEADFRKESLDAYLAKLEPEMARADTVAIVHTLHEMGVPQACVSNGEPEVIRVNLEFLGLDTIMQFFISGNDVQQGKPAPYPYAEAANRMGVPAGRCLAVEDSRVGIASALAAGCVGCVWPPSGEPVPPQHDLHIKNSDAFPLHWFFRK